MLSGIGGLRAFLTKEYIKPACFCQTYRFLEFRRLMLQAAGLS